MEQTRSQTAKVVQRLLSDYWGFCRETWWTYIAQCWRIVHMVPLVFALCAFLIFSFGGQLQEIYIRLMEGVARDSDWLPVLCGYLVITVIAWALFTSNVTLTRHRVTAHYGSLSNLYLDPWLIRARDLLATACAAAPFLGVINGIRTAGNDTASLREATALLTGTRASSAFPIDTAPYMIGVALVGAATLALFTWASRWRRAAPISAMTAAGVLVLGGLLLTLLAPPRLLAITSALGPLAMVAIQFLLLLTIAAAIAGMPRLIKRSIIALLAVAAIINWWLPTPSAPGPIQREPATPTVIVKYFEDWLGARRTGAQLPTAAPFPVFIVAAQGGGIVATSATAMFLARLSDECPRFLRHTFAISGVSGGAVGAALFDALAKSAGKERAGADACDPARRAIAGDSLAGVTRAVATVDHLSPVLGLLVPDIAFRLFGEIYHSLAPDRPLPLLAGRATRADALAESLACAAHPSQRKSRPPPCRADLTPSALRDAYADRFVQTPSAGPALILNTTSADGRKVAFAPFSLRGIGENDIWAFSDDPYNLDAAARRISLAAAAVASAGFPVLMPPFSLRGEAGVTWNFVDGGYADNSGVAAAGALYQTLKPYADAHGIDLRLLVLTGDEGEAISGGGLGTSVMADFRVPVEALLNVRAGIGPRQIVRAINQFDERKADDPLPKVPLIRFPTPFLGWTISRTTNDLLSAIVAPDLPCLEPREHDRRLAGSISPRTLAIANAINENACMAHRIKELLAKP